MAKYVGVVLGGGGILGANLVSGNNRLRIGSCSAAIFIDIFSIE